MDWAKPAMNWLIGMFNYNTVDESEVEFLEIAPSSELPDGERLFVEIGSKPIVIFKIAKPVFLNRRCLLA